MSKLLFTLIYIAVIFLGAFYLRDFFFKKELIPNIVIATQNLNINNSGKPTIVKNNAIAQVTTNTSMDKVISNSNNEIMAWMYPGDVTCNASLEYKDGRKIDILKPEYFSLKEGGNLTLLTEQNSGCNGYSLNNINDLKKYSKEQYVTVSSSDAVNMDIFLLNAINNQVDINKIVSFAVDNNISGVEIDFEDFGGWNQSIYDDYKKFITLLGNKLHDKNKKLMIDIPATSNDTEKQWYVWRYSDLASLPIDRLVVMTYDYQYDQGVGQPISPIFWIENSVKFALKEFPDKSKLSFGIPSYGYKGTLGTQKFSLLTYDQIKKEPGFETATRDPVSYEMTWQEGNTVYFYQDSESMTKKLETIKNAGINSVSVWHLGGNLWFN